MKHTIRIITIGLLSFLFFILAITSVHAASSCGFATSPDPVQTTDDKATFTFNGPDVVKAIKDSGKPFSGWLYWVYPQHDSQCAWTNAITGGGYYSSGGKITNENLIPASLTATRQKELIGACDNALLSQDHSSHTVQLIYEYDYLGSTDKIPICEGSYAVQSLQSTCDVAVTLPAGSKGDINSVFNVGISNIKFDPQYNAIVVKVDGKSVLSEVLSGTTKSLSVDHLSPPGDHPLEVYTAHFQTNSTGTRTTFTEGPLCSPAKSIHVSKDNETNACFDSGAADAEKNKNCSAPYADCDWCHTTSSGSNALNVKPLCEQLETENNSTNKERCLDCANGTNFTGTNPSSHKGIWTAIGCVPTDFTAIVNEYILTYGIGMAGGIAFLRFLYGAFLILTSGGNAEALEEAKQIITSSIIGLLIVIFSVFFLQTIGVDILQLPDFGTSCPGTRNCTKNEQCKQLPSFTYVCVPK